MAIHTEALASNASHTEPASRKQTITGWVISGGVMVFLLADAVSHVAMPQGVKDASYELGFTDGDIMTMGLVMLGCLAMYAFPRTSVLGAILLTGYLGGAVTALMVDENGFAVGALFPLVIGALVWLGLWLRNPSVRSILLTTRS